MCPHNDTVNVPEPGLAQSHTAEVALLAVLPSCVSVVDLSGDYGPLEAPSSCCLFTRSTASSELSLYLIGLSTLRATMLIAAEWSRKLDFRKRPSESPLRAWVQDNDGCGERRPSSVGANVDCLNRISCRLITTSILNTLRTQRIVCDFLPDILSVSARLSLFFGHLRDKDLPQTTTSTVAKKSDAKSLQLQSKDLRQGEH